MLFGTTARRLARRPFTLGFLAAAIAGAPIPALEAQTKKALSIDDYPKWRYHDGGSLSPDGKWVSYTFRFREALDQQPVLHIQALDTAIHREIPNGSQASFADDGRWIAYYLDLPYAEAKQKREAGQPTPRKAVLMNLATGEQTSWDNIQTFSFSKGSRYLVLRRPGSDPNAKHSGTDVILRDLKTGLTKVLGNVGEASFNKKGELYAYTVDAAQRDVNGVEVYDTRSGVSTTLDSDAKRYSQLTWNEEGTALAVLKGTDVEGKANRENGIVAFPDIYATLSHQGVRPEAVRFDPTAVAEFPKQMVVTEAGQLTWSKDRKLIFFGTRFQLPTAAKKKGTDEVPDLDVWHWKDPELMSVQRNRADQDRRFTYIQAFDLGTGRFIRLTDSAVQAIQLNRDGTWGIGRDDHPYFSDWKEPRADIYRINPANGERTLIIKELLGQGGQLEGKNYLYWQDGNHWLYDLETGTNRNLTGNAPVTFVNAEFDYRGTPPSYGVAGWTTDGKAVILNHRYDLWLQPLDGSPAKNLTNGVGATNSVRFSIVDLDYETQGIDLSKPLMLSAFGKWSKKSGFYELKDNQLREIVFEDARFGFLTKAKNADRYLFTRESWTEFPDLRISGPDLQNSTKITNANPQEAEFAWGRRILFEYTNKAGVRLQGTLAIPDDYVPGQRLPMIVDFYEKMSDNFHSHLTPTYMSGFARATIEPVTKGYLVMEPDIHFGTNAPHADMLECIEAATKKVIEMGYADPKRIGLHGHSFSGQGAAYISTKSKMFAAIGMGAGVTDLYGDFNRFWGWSYTVPGGGANGNQYNFFGQGRMGTDPWTNPELYYEQSALHNAANMNTPLLILHGTMDGVVAVMEGMQFFSALRFLGKPAILLAYMNEGHGLSALANRRDFTIRTMQFFDHYLKGLPAARWITEGVPYVEKEARLNPPQ